MKNPTKILMAIAVFVFAVIVVIRLVVNAEKIRPALERQLGSALGRTVKFGDLRFSVLSGSLVASDVSISEDPGFGAAPFLTAKEVRIGVSLRPLILAREVRLRSFRIESTQISLIRAFNGTWNFSSIGHGAAPWGNSKVSLPALPDLSVGRISVDDGRLTASAQPAHGDPSVYDHVNLSARDFSFTSQFPFDLSASLPAGGTLSASGRFGPINRNDAASSPFEAQVTIKNLDPVAAAFLNPNAGISFLADMDVHAVSDGQTVASNGTIHFENLKLRKGATPAPKPIDLAFSSTHRLKENNGEIQDSTVKIGDAAIHVTGTYQIVDMDAKNAVLNLKISGQDLPIDDLQGLMAAAAVRLPNGSVLKGGTLSVNLDVSGEEKSPLILGTIDAGNTRLVGFDVGSKIHGIAALSGVQTGDTTEFEKVAMFVRVTNSGETIDKIEAVIPAMGRFTGSGTISPDDQLNFRLIVIGVKAKGLGKLGIGILTMFNGASGATAVPMRVTGTAEDPSITADVGGIVQKQTKSLFNNSKN